MAVVPATHAATSSTLFIPENAPTGVSDDWCAAGTLTSEKYAEAWTRIRAAALTAEASGDTPCLGISLARLALLAETQDYSREADPYWHKAHDVLAPILPASDPQLARLDIELAEVATARGELEQARGHWSSAVQVLRLAHDSGNAPASLNCPPTAEPSDWEIRRPIERQLVEDEAMLGHYLIRAEFGVLGALLGAADWDAALTAAGRLEALLEERLERKEEPGVRSNVASHASWLSKQLR